MESNSNGGPNWVALPEDVTFSILSRLETVDLLRSARVCSSWFKICKDPLLWKTINIDIRNVKQISELVNMCHSAIDRSSGRLINILIKFIATDDLLNYIANRSSKLKCLQLRYCYDVSDNGLSQAVAKLPLLEELELTHGSVTKESLETVGRCCPYLKSLKFNYQGPITFSWGWDPDEDVEIYNEDAMAIAKHMPELRHLELVENDLTDVGLQAILDGCPHLESLNLLHCFRLSTRGDLKTKCAQRIKCLQLPSDL